MTGRSARTFLPDLRRLERELPVPLPDRMRILRELESDLEGLRDGLVARGMSADEARRRALEALFPDRLARSELGRLHQPLYRRVTRSVDGDRLRLIERSALALATAVVLLAEAAVLLRVDLLDAPSPFLWPVLALGAGLFALCAARVFQAWARGDPRPSDRGAGLVLGVSGLVLAVGIVGSLVDVYRLAGILQQAPERAPTLTVRWLVQDSVLLSVSILLSMGGGLVWFVLAQWTALVSGERREVLGLEGTGREEPSPREAAS